MSDSLAALLTGAPAPGGAPALILDTAAYAQHVLLQDREVPWHDATAYANHLGQAQALLKPAVALVPLDRMLQREIDADAQLREAMGARSRTGFAAKTLLGEEGVRDRVRNLVTTVVKTLREPVVLHLPAPLALLAITSAAAGTGGSDDFDDDDAENAAIYYADWLRAFAETGVSGLIFDERRAAASTDSYQPIMNAAQHYRWPVGLRGPSEVRFSAPDAVLPVLGAEALDHDGPGAQGRAGIPNAGVLFAEVPEHAVPERVLARLGEIRADA